MNGFYNITAPDGIPQQLRTNPPTVSSITISWDRVNCLQRNSEITGYRVIYRRTGVTDPLLEASLVGTETADRVFTATGLLPRTNYTFNVMAVNSNSEVGPPATISAITATPEGKQLFCCHHVPQHIIILPSPQILLFCIKVYFSPTTALLRWLKLEWIFLPYSASQMMKIAVLHKQDGCFQMTLQSTAVVICFRGEDWACSVWTEYRTQRWRMGCINVRYQIHQELYRHSTQGCILLILVCQTCDDNEMQIKNNTSSQLIRSSCAHHEFGLV